MKKLALGLATAGTFAVMAIGLAGPAMAASPVVGTGHDAVYVDDHTATYQAVDCSVHVNSSGTNVDVNWC
ncbi:MAG TPA: hypothetical protein VEQ67_17110 [Mycobacterium sp.]|nr:hypothetical protein [Mycobacterium sp.]